MALPEVSFPVVQPDAVLRTPARGGPQNLWCGPTPFRLPTVCDRLSWISAYAVGYGVVGCAAGDPGTRKSSGMSHERGLSSPTLGYLCAMGSSAVWRATSRSRVAWDCSLKCDVYPSQGAIQTWDR